MYTRSYAFTQKLRVNVKKGGTWRVLILVDVNGPALHKRIKLDCTAEEERISSEKKSKGLLLTWFGQQYFKYVVFEYGTHFLSFYSFIREFIRSV